MSFIADRDEFNSETDKPDLGICDYHSPTDIPVQPENPDSTQSILATISGNANLKIDLIERTLYHLLTNLETQSIRNFHGML